ncbi:hypothetical protein [Nocardia sp. NPDC051981]|uniref:hypothetical protein n=1 Tax=Nocardia sp. NPDC051981 TaxID=3155417 RepID=UPI0034259CB0
MGAIANIETPGFTDTLNGLTWPNVEWYPIHDSLNPESCAAARMVARLLCS